MNSSYKNLNQFEVDENCRWNEKELEGLLSTTLILILLSSYFDKVLTYIFDSNHHYSDIVIDVLISKHNQHTGLHEPNSLHSIAALSARWHQARGRRAINL